MMHLRETLLVCSALLAPASLGAQSLPPAMQGPSGGRVVAGQASISQTLGATNITQGTNRAVINWNQFNVGAKAKVEFQQPSAQSWALNRVTGADPSVIAGQLRANGGIAIVNRSGITVAQGARIDVGSLIASTSDIRTRDFMQGTMQFDRAPPRPGARVDNRGQITVRQGGMAALVGPEVANSGTIRAKLGRVALAGGAEAWKLDLAGDGLLALDVTKAVQQAPAGATALVTNTGTIRAEGGSVLLTAHAASGIMETLVAHSGRIETGTTLLADGTQRPGIVALRAVGGGTEVTGRIDATGRQAGRDGGSVEVNATGAVTLARGAVVDVSGAAGGGRATIGAGLESRVGQPVRLARSTTIAQGAVVKANATRSGQGGTVIVHSAEATTMLGSIDARGGAQGGDGGLVEISSRSRFRMDGGVDTAAAAGTPGTLLLDPVTLNVVSALTGSTEPAEVTAASVGGTSGALTLAADSVINVNAAINKPAGALTLRTNNAAGGGIFLNADVTVSSSSFTATTAGTILQSGGTTLNAGGAITLTGGGIALAGSIRGTGTSAVTLTANGGANDGAANFGGILALGKITGNAGVTLAATGGYIGIGPVGWFNTTSRLPSSESARLPAIACSLADCGTVSAGTTLSVTAGREIGVGGTLAGGVLAPPAGNNAVNILAGTDIGNDGSIAGTGGGAIGLSGVPVSAVLMRASGSITNTGTIQGLVNNAQSNSGLVFVDTTQTSNLMPPYPNPNGGSVINGGTISSGSRVVVFGQAGVVNSLGGTITGSGTGVTTSNSSVAVQSAGSISNAGTITATGGGNGGASALFIQARGGIDNSGSLQANGTLTTGSGGLRLDTAFAASTTAAPNNPGGGGIRNSGNIAADNFVTITAQTGVSNTGSIVGRGIADSEGTRSTGNGLFINAGGDVTNPGVLRAAGGGGTNSAGNTTSAVAINSAGAIDNSGQIVANSTPGASTSGGLYIDTRGFPLGATDVTPIYTTGTSIRNSGTILADYYVTIGARGSFTNTTDGSILATRANVASGRVATNITSGQAFLNQGNIEGYGGDAANAAVVLRSQTTLTNTGTVLAGVASPGGNVVTNSGGLRLDTTGGTNVGDPPTYTTGDTITNSGTLIANGRLNLTSLTGIVNSGTLNAGLQTQIQAAPNLRLLATTTVANTGSIATSLGDLLVQAPTGVLAAGALSSPKTVTINAASGGIRLTAPIVADTLALQAPGGAITQVATGAGISATTLTLQAASADLTGAANNIQNIGASRLTGALALATAGAISVTGPVSAGAVTFAAPLGTVTLSADVTATSGNILLTAGAIEQDAGTTLRASGDVVMQAAGILLSGALNAGGNVTLAATSPIPGFPQSVGVLALSGPVTAGGDATLSAITGAQLSAPLAAETLTLKSNLVLLEGAAFTLGKAGLISAPAGLLFGNQVTLRPRDVTRLPTLILDGRSANALATLPGFVQPDSPGIAANQQPTQLAQFGAASLLPALPLALNLDAGQSAVFVLADGATIGGSVTAGRLGILGTGGSSNLVGVLGGQAGAAAVALASASATAVEAVQYSFNGATIGTVVTTPQVIMLPVIVPPVTVPPVTDVTPPAAVSPPAATLTPPSGTPSVTPVSTPGNASILAESAPPTVAPATPEAIEAVAAALVSLPVNISVGVSATAASAGVSIAGPGVIGNGFTATAATLAQQPETIAELRATEPGAAAEQRNSFSRRFVPPASPVHTRPAQGRLSDPEVLLPDSGGNDY